MAHTISPRKLQHLLAALLIVAGIFSFLFSASFSTPSGAAPHCVPAPARNSITFPSSCVTAPIVSVADVKGDIQIPADVHDVGWYVGSAKLTAQHGNTVLVGHVNYYGQGTGAFAVLGTLATNSRIGINLHGVTKYFRVVSRTRYRKGHLPWKLFTPTGQRYLTLITCGGQLLHYTDGWHYTQNVVVQAVPTK